MSASNQLAVSWSNLPERLIKQSSILRDYISSDAYLNDQDRISFQILALEIIGLKNELHSGVIYTKFIESEECRDILARYLQFQLNQITNLKNDFNVFLISNSLVPTIHPNLLKSPPMNPEKSAEESTDISLNKPEGLFLNHKKAFLDSISFFISKLQCQRESYKILYSQKDNVQTFLSCNLAQVKCQLPATTYTLERLCENVRTHLQDIRLQIQGVRLGEKKFSQQENLNLFKGRYNKIKTLPIIQYFAKLFKVIRELKTSSFQFSKAIVAFQTHLKDKEIMSSAQELIERIEQEAEVRGKLRRQSDPTIQLTPKKLTSQTSRAAAQTLPKNETTLEQLQFELDSEMTNDRSSQDEDSLIPMNTIHSRTQSDHSAINEMIENEESISNLKNDEYVGETEQMQYRLRSQSLAACEESIKAMNPDDNRDNVVLFNMKQQCLQSPTKDSLHGKSNNHHHHEQPHQHKQHLHHQLQHRHLNSTNDADTKQSKPENLSESKHLGSTSTTVSKELRYRTNKTNSEMAVSSNKSSQLSASGFIEGDVIIEKTYYTNPNKGGCEGKCMVCNIF